MHKRPSFVLFITDQQRADYLGCYGHPVLRTPNIDSLAANGICYDRFHVASPVCMPNRSSLMTGRMPSAHGVRLNGIPLALESVTFVDLLRAAGYRTGLVGKSHLQNFSGQPPYSVPREPRVGRQAPAPENAVAVRRDLGSRNYRQEDPNVWASERGVLEAPFYGFEHVDLVIGHGDRCAGDYADWVRVREPEVDRLLGPDNQLAHDYVCPQAIRTALPEALHSTSYVRERAVAFLEDVGEAPFFLMVSFPDPHHPFSPPGRFWDLYCPDDMQVPPAFARNDWTPPPHVAAVLEQRERSTAMLGGKTSIGSTVRESMEAQALTCGMIAMIDEAIGEVLGALTRAGKANDTVVLFTTDHGEHLGDHRLLFKGAEQYSQLTRVPFIWSDPEGPSGARSNALGQTLDIPATILERARVERFEGMQGRDLLGEPARDAAFIQYEHQRPHAGLDGTPQVHTVVEATWRMSVYRGQAWGELYDLEHDPDELDNRWSDPAAAAEKARLMERLVRLEMEAIDRSPAPTHTA